MVNDSVVIYRHHQFTARDKKLNQFTAIVTVHTYHLLIGEKVNHPRCCHRQRRQTNVTHSKSNRRDPGTVTDVRPGVRLLGYRNTRRVHSFYAFDPKISGNTYGGPGCVYSIVYYCWYGSWYTTRYREYRNTLLGRALNWARRRVQF
jgi:hypothetical protein